MVGIDHGPPTPELRRGDIHWVDFPEIGGHMIRGPHPGVIVQTDRLRASSTVIVLPLTSTAKAAEFDPPFLVRVRARDAGLPRDGWIKCYQPTTVPNLLLGPKGGRLDPETLEWVDAALRFVLGI